MADNFNIIKCPACQKEMKKVFIPEKGINVDVCVDGCGGISWGIKKCIEKELENKELYELPVSFPIPKTKFSIAYNSNILNKTTTTFIKYLKEEIKNISD